MALGICLAARGGGTEPTAVRSISRYDAALVALTVGCGALACLAAGGLAHTELGAVAARNLVDYVGLVLLAGELGTWQAAGVAPVAFVVISFSLGRSSAVLPSPTSSSDACAKSIAGTIRTTRST
ncbi:hypothetical protein [Cryptosporangium aurantiacum]|nr:hypothetical protein [Cryptosporangium aurantiacum]